jgi:hypothetical protein
MDVINFNKTVFSGLTLSIELESERLQTLRLMTATERGNFMKEISRRRLLRPTRDLASQEPERDRPDEATLDKIGRRELLKGGAAGVLALGALGLAATPAFADDGGGGLLVHVHGNLQGYGATPSTVRLAVSFEVFGRSDSLAGAGWDGGTGTSPTGLVPGGPPPGGPVAACYYTASGSLKGRTLTLVGRSLFTNRALTTADAEDPGKSDARADGRDFNATVNVRTGRVINWSLSPIGGTFMSDPANPSLVMVTRSGRTRP